MTPGESLHIRIVIGLLAGTLMAFHLLPLHPAVAYACVFLAGSALYVWFARLLMTSDLTSRTLILLLGFGLLLRLSFLPANPVGSDDVYRYIWDGKVQAAGINPYRYAPDAAELRHLHTPLLPGAVNHPDMKTVYFPVAQWLFFLCYQIAGENLWAIKLLLFLAECVTLAGLYALAGRWQIGRQFLLLYALCPLPILQFAIDAHMDGLGLPLLVVGLLMYARGRLSLSLLLLALSASIKPITIVILPILLLSRVRWVDRLRIILVPAVVLAVQFLPYVFTSNPFEALTTFTKHWIYNGSLFELLNVYISDNQKTRIVCAFLLAVALGLLYFSRRDIITKVFYAILLVLLCSPVVHPWYVAWMVVLLPLARQWSGILYAATVSLTGFTVVHYKLFGVWEQYPLVLVLEYAPVLVVLLWEMWGGGNMERREPLLK